MFVLVINSSSMDYDSICTYIFKNGGQVDDKMFRLSEEDGKVRIDRWMYDFPKPSDKDVLSMNKQEYKQFMKDQERENFKSLWFYPYLVELIDERMKQNRDK